MAEILNLNPDYGISTTYNFKNYSHELYLGRTYHNILWQQPLAEISFSSAWFYQDIYTYLNTFFGTVNGSQDLFLFKDPIDYHAEPFQFFTGHGAYTQGIVQESNGIFQLVKKYVIEGVPQYEINRPITRPDVATITVYDGMTPINVTIDPDTGLVTGLTPGGTYSWEGQFYIPVRFANDILPQELVSFNGEVNSTMYAIPDLLLREVRETALSPEKSITEVYPHLYDLTFQYRTALDNTSKTLIYTSESGYEQREKTGTFLRVFENSYTNLTRKDIEYLLVLTRLTFGDACAFQLEDTDLSIPSTNVRFSSPISFSLVSSPDDGVADDDQNIYDAGGVSLIEVGINPEDLVTFQCYLWDITDNEGTVVGYTNHDQEVEDSSIIYRPRFGLSSTATSNTAQLNTDTVELVSALTPDTSGITEADLLAGKYNDATLKQYLYSWKDSVIVKSVFRGNLGGYTLDYTERDSNSIARIYQFEALSFTNKLDTTPIIQTAAECEYEFLSQGDRACNRVIDSTVRIVVTVVSSTKASITVDTNVDGYNLGTLLVNDGRLTGQKYIIGDASGFVLDLFYPLSEALVAGVTLTLTKRCAKTLGACNGFNNLVHHGGFPELLGTDLQIVSPEQP